MKKYLALIWLVLLGVAIYYLRDFATSNSYSIGEALKEIIKILQSYIADAGIYAGIIYIFIHDKTSYLFSNIYTYTYFCCFVWTCFGMDFYIHR